MKTRLLKENFTSIHELVATLNSRPKNKVMEYDNSSESGSYDFTKTHSYAEAEKLLVYGYEEVLEQIKSGVSEDELVTNKLQIRNHVVGHVPHVPNSLLNLPISMIEISTQPRKVKGLSLIYCPVSNGGTDAQVFIDNGIKILNVLNSIEAVGIKVNLKVSFKFSSEYDSGGDTEITLGTVDLKSFNEPLNLKKVCFPMVHPSFLRRIGFKWLETYPHLTVNDWNNGYGRSLTLNDENYHTMKKSLKSNEILISLGDIKDKTEDEIMEMINRGIH